MTIPAVTTGKEGDISNLCTYAWYEWCYYCEHTTAFPHNKEVLGHALGLACSEGNEMDQWILKVNGQVVPCQSLCPLTIAEKHHPIEVKMHAVFDSLIEKRLGTSMGATKYIRSDRPGHKWGQ